MKFLKLFFRLLKYLLVIIILAGLVLGVAVLSSYKDLKAAGSSALAGKANLEAAALAVKQGNWNSASDNSVEASENIEESLAILEGVKDKAAFKALPILRNQVLDLEYLLKTADIISRSLNGAVPIAKKFESLFEGKENHKFSGLDSAEKAEFFKLIHESEPELNGLKANLDLALLNINRIHRIGVLWPVYKQISNLKLELQQANNLLSQATPLLKVLPELAGYPDESNFLFIMHNNDELRPSGGFIGVFGLLKSASGDIVSLKTYDSYHLDMPAVGKWIMTPPPQISKYMSVKNWYMRDANWSPDWPTSAKKIQEIYFGENLAVNIEADPLSGVIGITPKFVSDLLRLVGDITVRGEKYTPENLQTLLQYNVEVAYKEQDISTWDRKDVINELLAELKYRLFALDTDKLPNLLEVFADNALEKDVQIFFNDPYSQVLTPDLNVDGNLKNPESDYLMVVDANLAAFKSDAVMKKDVEYDINRNKDGQAIANLKISYSHEGGYDWRTTRYRTYTRIYVPLGSKLIAIRALEKANMEDSSITSYDDFDLNKTVIGVFFQIEPGTKGAINFQYSLPEKISQDLKNKSYQLYAQKQAGRRTQIFKASINGVVFTGDFNRDITINPYAN